MDNPWQEDESEWGGNVWGDDQNGQAPATSNVSLSPCMDIDTDESVSASHQTPDAPWPHGADKLRRDLDLEPATVSSEASLEVQTNGSIALGSDWNEANIGRDTDHHECKSHETELDFDHQRQTEIDKLEPGESQFEGHSLAQESEDGLSAGEPPVAHRDKEAGKEADKEADKEEEEEEGEDKEKEKEKEEEQEEKEKEKEKEEEQEEKGEIKEEGQEKVEENGEEKREDEGEISAREAAPVPLADPEGEASETTDENTTLNNPPDKQVSNDVLHDADSAEDSAGNELGDNSDDFAEFTDLKSTLSSLYPGCSTDNLKSRAEQYSSLLDVTSAKNTQSTTRRLFNEITRPTRQFVLMQDADPDRIVRWQGSHTEKEVFRIMQNWRPVQSMSRGTMFGWSSSRVAQRSLSLNGKSQTRTKRISRISAMSQVPDLNVSASPLQVSSPPVTPRSPTTTAPEQTPAPTGTLARAGQTPLQTAQRSMTPNPIATNHPPNLTFTPLTPTKLHFQSQSLPSSPRTCTSNNNLINALDTTKGTPPLQRQPSISPSPPTQKPPAMSPSPPLNIALGPHRPSTNQAEKAVDQIIQQVLDTLPDLSFMETRSESLLVEI